MELFIGSDGYERLRAIPKDDGADKLKSKDIHETEEVITPFDLGGTNAPVNKSGSGDDDELAADLHDMFNGVEVSPRRKGNVSPLLMDDENNANNATSYSSEDDDILAGLDGDESNQLKDTQQINQPSGTEEQQPNQRVLTKQGVMDLVRKDANTLTPGS